MLSFEACFRKERTAEVIHVFYSEANAVVHALWWKRHERVSEDKLLNAPLWTD